MKLMTLTCAVFPSEAEARKKLWIFLASCKKFGIEPYLYGIGRTFPGYREMKLDMQLEYIKANKGNYTHVLYTDSWDAFFLTCICEIEQKYRNYGSPPILVAAYSGLANVPEPDKDYPNCFDESLYYRYPHVGGYIAEIDAIVEAFEKMLKLPAQTGDDCFNWYDAWSEGWFRPKLDFNCEIFQVTDEHCILVYEFNKDYRIMNTMTEREPCILHLSGGYTDPAYGKDEVLKPWAQRLGII